MGRNMRARAGNYQAPVDTTGMDEEMKRTLQTPTKLSREERAFVADREKRRAQREAEYGAGKSPMDVVGRIRKANRQPPPKGGN